MKKPILYLNFNRPRCTARSFEAIRRYRPKKLYISVDGSRKSAPSDWENVAQVKALLEHINWDCQVVRWYHRQNQGCKRAVQKSLSQFFALEEEGIILEDDCVPTPSFFKFVENLLDKYRDDERVATIHGCSLGFKDNDSKESYFFTQFMNMWGWATWKRTYQLVDNNMTAWTQFDDKYRFLKKVLAHYGSECDFQWLNYWYSQFSRTANGEVDTWDFQWIFNLLQQGKFCVVPSENLVENIGWGVNATHTHLNAALSQLKSAKMSFPLRHPRASKIQANYSYETHIKNVWCGINPSTPRP